MSELSPAIQTKIRNSFARQNMMATFGAELTVLEPGRCTIVAPILPLALQQHGSGHAGLSFTIGDTAAGYAGATVMPEESEVMTVEMKINLLSPTIGQRIVAEGRVIRPGRRLVIVTADVWAENEGARKHVAILQGTMIPV